jgi:hypothetical protein
MNEQSKITDICKIFILFSKGREETYAGLSIPAGIYKDDVFLISSHLSFQNYAFEVPRVPIWRRRERMFAGRVNALPTQRFCRNDDPNDVLLWDRLLLELRRQRLTITDTTSIAPNTQEGLRKTPPPPVAVFLCPVLDSVLFSPSFLNTFTVSFSSNFFLSFLTYFLSFSKITKFACLTLVLATLQVQYTQLLRSITKTETSAG